MEIESRCYEANQLIGQMAPILKNKHVSIATKRAIYNTIFLPTLCYQCQTWTMTAKVKRRILNVSRKDRIKNDDIRRRVGVKPVLDYIQKQKVK